MFSSTHLCCTSCAYNHVLISLPGVRWVANGGREWESSWLSHQCLERQVGQCCSWNLTCTRCQRQTATAEAYNSASAITWPSRWTLVSFVTSGKLAGWSVHVYNMHPNFERGNCGENCAYYNGLFIVLILIYIYFMSTQLICQTLYCWNLGERQSSLGLQGRGGSYLWQHHGLFVLKAKFTA